jgi:hypothetical protein
MPDRPMGFDRVPAPIDEGRGSCPGNSEPNTRKIQMSALQPSPVRAGSGFGMDSPHLAFLPWASS